MLITATDEPGADFPGPIDTGGGLGKGRRKGPVLCLALLSVVYLVPTCVRAAKEKLWFDEICTFDAATLSPSLKTLWPFLKEIDPSPPIGFILAAGSESIFGRNEFGLRLPSIIAFWIMALCLYLYLSRRLPWPFCIAAMLLTVLTAAGRYSYEARPYALVLALAGIALVAWQAAAERRRRRLALVSLAVALAAALCSHAMAITLALPFAAGELTRTIQRKRVDWPVWCAFASTAPAVLVLWKLKGGGDAAKYDQFSGSFGWHIIATYLQILTPAIAPIGLAFLLALVLRKQATSSVKRTQVVPQYELAALVGFALIPFAAVPLATLGEHYWFRYSLNCTIGLAGLLAVLLFSLCGTARLPGVAVMLVFGVCFAIGRALPESVRTDGAATIVNSSEEIQPFLGQIPPDAPIVIGPALTFVELEHYSSPRLAARLYYLTKSPGADAIAGEAAFEVKGPLLAHFVPFRAHFEDYQTFIAAHRRFYFVRPSGNIERDSTGPVSLQPRETPGHFQYYEANAQTNER